MGVGLQPLEFSECLADSPAFRENLQRHEKELERTSQQIKRLIKEVKDVVHAAKRLGAAQLALAASMEQFEFACIGASMTEDERVISRSLHHFAALIRTIEDERERMLGRAHEQIIQPLERFRKEHIGAVKEGKKKFDKKTAKFCQTQERTLSLSTKKPDAVFQEADAALDMAERDFCQASVEYVFLLQAVQERKKFELVETLLGFVFGWWTFHHTAHDVHADAEPRVRDLQLRIQRTRSNFEEASKQTEHLMKKMMDMRQMNKEGVVGEEGAARAGYLFLMEKKAFGTAWTKQYATYEPQSRSLALTPYNQINPKAWGSAGCESVCVCEARVAADCERRFCWEAVPEEAAVGAGGGAGAAGGVAGAAAPPLTLQALSEPGRAAWLRAIHNTPPLHRNHVAKPKEAAGAGAGAEGEVVCALDEAGFELVRRLVAAIEERGLHEQGLYRVAGVSSKVWRLVRLSAGGRPPADLRDPLQWETKTLTSALKAYLRSLPERLIPAQLHGRFVSAAKCERRADRVRALRQLAAALPHAHRDMLTLVLQHLRNVCAHSSTNLMTSANLAVCFGPTLLRAEQDSVASILELKFYNVLVETMLDHYSEIFEGEPPPAPAPAPAPTQPRTQLALLPAHNGILRASPPGAGAAGCARDLHWSSGVSVGAGAGGRWGGAGPYGALSAGCALSAGSAGSALSTVSASSGSEPDSVSSHSASPPPRPPHFATVGVGVGVGAGQCVRVRTLYACLGESEGELSFEPNQIITNVARSAEPGWLRGTLNGRTGLVPENYVEPLP